MEQLETADDSQCRTKFQRLVHTSLECGVSKKTTLKLIKAFVDDDSDDCPTTWKQLLKRAGNV